MVYCTKCGAQLIENEAHDCSKKKEFEIPEGYQAYARFFGKLREKLDKPFVPAIVFGICFVALFLPFTTIFAFLGMLCLFAAFGYEWAFGTKFGRGYILVIEFYYKAISSVGKFLAIIFTAGILYPIIHLAFLVLDIILVGASSVAVAASFGIYSLIFRFIKWIISLSKGACTKIEYGRKCE